VDSSSLPKTPSTVDKEVSQSKFVPPDPPEDGIELKVGILTVSDRASANLYESGDLSGPAVESSLLSAMEEILSQKTNQKALVKASILCKDIVPDEEESIIEKLKEWSKATGDSLDSNSCNLIFTTGGTGFSPRDITPEATKKVLDLECPGLLTWASTECSVFGGQPMAALSRGTAGVRGRCMIVNLPGNPGGLTQLVKLLLPLLLHAVKDL